MKENKCQWCKKSNTISDWWGKYCSEYCASHAQSYQYESQDLNDMGMLTDGILNENYRS